MDEIAAMKLAIAEAYKGATAVSPNPLVGCVVLDRNGNLIGQGHHEFYGGPHAEVNALKNLSSEQLKGAHVFVTLEPCAHEGKTPSCAKMLAKLPIAKVTYGLVDPNPLVSGQGAKILEAAEIKTELFPHLQSELQKVCEAFLWNQTKKAPFVALKIASSLDGQMALKSGESKWITGEKSREHVHYLRACYDAILVGAGTIKADNPSLNIRHAKIQKENKVIVLDSRGDLLKNYDKLNIAKTHKPENVYWCVSSEFQATHITDGPLILKIKKQSDGKLDLRDLLQNLWQQKIHSVFVEGGAQVASSFTQAKLVNRLYLFQAPIILGAGGARAWTSGITLQSMNEKSVLKNAERFNFDPDQLITGLLS